MSAIDDLIPLRSNDDEFDDKLPTGETMALGDITVEKAVDPTDQASLDPKDFWHEDESVAPGTPLPPLPTAPTASQPVTDVETASAPSPLPETQPPADQPPEDPSVLKIHQDN